MLIGLNLNVNDTVSETAAKTREAERLGLDYVWISDLPSQRYAPVVAAAAAAATEKKDRRRIDQPLPPIFAAAWKLPDNLDRGLWRTL